MPTGEAIAVQFREHPAIDIGTLDGDAWFIRTIAALKASPFVVIVND